MAIEKGNKFDDRELSLQIARERANNVKFKDIQDKLNIHIDDLKATSFNTVRYEIYPKFQKGVLPIELINDDDFWNKAQCDKKLGLELISIIDPEFLKQNQPIEGESIVTTKTQQTEEAKIEKVAEQQPAPEQPAQEQIIVPALLRKEEAGGALFFSIITASAFITLNYDSVKSAIIVNANDKWNLRITTKPEKRLVVETGAIVDISDTYNIEFNTPEEARSVYPFASL